MEKELVDTGVIQIHNIYFDTGKATLKSASHRVLHDIAAILVKWPSLKIEIGGHADATGPDDANLELSRRRAHAVLDWLIDNYDELKFDQFFVRGYGEAQPVASNDTVDGRRQNRRVEFKVLNREGLPDR
jgi:outer membrane protein OmpA-like peptidoglycan-associated protein